MNSNPIKIQDPSKLIKEAKDIISKVSTWNKSKTYKHAFKDQLIDVNTYTEDFNNDIWFARSSILDKQLTAKYKDKFFKYLIGDLDIKENHSTHEKEYIHEFFDYELKESDNSYIMKAYYQLPFPMKRRLFYEWIHIERHEDEAYLFSFSLDPEVFEEGKEIEDGYVIGKYTSIEHIKIMDGELNWVMCTASTPGGLIPNWVSRMSIPGAISKDVPSFLNYIDKF
ncbi:hypothetical protein CLIB1444_02S02916 [[Candida] jaroonii]|uniref:Uncharacterized protein n=1 Tax=[Candida] jaroonii TaxID=467808 RepID=A0ACA9Y3H1_9ASCO|nr:hypothetical protein CLIB1444_02S02916 [[Candida] jaroonii]